MGSKIASEEYLQRQQNLQRKIREHELEAFVVTSFDSIYYLTGAGFEPLERPFFLLFRAEGEPVLLVPKLDQEHMAKAHGIDAQKIFTYSEYPAPDSNGWPSKLQEHLPQIGNIGVEPSLRREISDQLAGYSLRTMALVDQLRVIKSPAELEMIRRAARYADLGVARLLSSSYFGSTVAEGFAETRTVSTRIVQEVEDWDPLMTKVIMATWAAPHSAMPHSIPALHHRLEKGPHVALVLTRVNGYSAESERTYFTAPPTLDERAAFAAMMEARRLAFGLVKPGVSCEELDMVVSDFLEKEGYAGELCRLHRIGHGVGLGTHEAPWLAEGSHDRLAANMVISIEPGIYLSGTGGFRHSDTVLVTERGCEQLTRFPADLDSLVVRSWRPSARIRGRFVRRKLRVKGRNALRC